MGIRDRPLSVHAAGLGKRLRAARKRLGISQRVAAVRSGLSRSVINHTEAGRSVPPLDAFARLCLLYGADPADLLALKRNPHASHPSADR